MTIHRHGISDGVGLTVVGTTVVWVGCVAVGITGLWAPLQPRSSTGKHLAPVQATLIHVELTNAAALLQHSAPPQAQPRPLAAGGPPPTPTLAAVAAPSAVVAFALPATGPVRIVSAAEAVPTGSPANDAKVQRMTYGQGEGAQPKPDYPPEAELDRQEGVVLVRFTIGEEGRVTAAEVIAPTPYPLLNQSALRTIREDWQFAPGTVREREISIEFKLK